ncbi:MAG: hypothetical protein ABW252_15850 [Polyangiales bacterium]
MKREALIFLTLSSQLACATDDPADWGDADEAQAQQVAAVDAGAVATTSGDAGVQAKVGEFSLQLVAPIPAFTGHSATPGFTSLLGKVYRGPLPEALVWEPKASAEGCTLSTPRVPFCEEGCGTGICVEDGVCKPSPATVNAGTLTVKGIRTEAGQTSFTVSPIRNNYITPGAVRLPYPAFDEGAAIEMTTSGGDIAPIALTSSGVAPLTLSGGTAGGYPLERGKPLALAWNKPGASSKSRIQVKLDISHHGGTKGKIECDVDDDGALSIPASLTDALVDLGIAGFPTVMVTRSAIGSTSTALGRVDLRIYGYVETAVVIPGLVSCTDDSECGGGKTCRDDKSCG